LLLKKFPLTLPREAGKEVALRFLGIYGFPALAGKPFCYFHEVKGAVYADTY
jgi:hypothetical protein